MSAIMRVPLLMVLITRLAPAYTLAQPPSPTSQPPPRGSFLGLQQAIELGLDHHPLVQEAGATLKAANARTGQARSIYYPRVDANFDTTAGAGRLNPRFLVGGFLVQPNLSQYVGGVSVSQRIFDFGFSQHTVRLSPPGRAGPGAGHQLQASARGAQCADGVSR